MRLCLQIVYYDGQFNDARMAVSVACTAAAAGAAICNHAEVTQLIKDPATGRVVGAKVRDNLTGTTNDVYAKVVINATGPFSDSIRCVCLGAILFGNLFSLPCLPPRPLCFPFGLSMGPKSFWGASSLTKHNPPTMNHSTRF